MSQDLYLHIAVGRWILRTHHVPLTGIFSGSMPHAPWVAHEWLASVCTAWVFSHFGWSGVLIGASILLSFTVAFIAWETSRVAGPLIAAVCAVLTWGLCLIHVQARPHLMVLPLFALWVGSHVRARSAGRAPPLYLASLMIVWANLHGSFLVGPAFTLVMAAEAAYEAENWSQVAQAVRAWAPFFIAAAGSALLTPHGFAGLLFPIRLTSMTAALDGITEWAPSSLANNPSLILVVLLTLFLALHYRFRPKLTRIAMLLGLIYLAFAHLRYTELLAIAAPLLLLDAFSSLQADLLDATGARLRARAFGRAWNLAAALLVACLAAGATALAARDPRHPLDRLTPAAAVDWAKAKGLRGPVMNAYNFGGYLIFRGVAPYIDGRVELYGQDFVVRNWTLARFPDLLEDYHAEWAIYEPSDPRNILLDHMPGWKRAYGDAQAVIHVRSPQPPPGS